MVFSTAKLVSKTSAYFKTSRVYNFCKSMLLTSLSIILASIETRLYGILDKDLSGEDSYLSSPIYCDSRRSSFLFQVNIILVAIGYRTAVDFFMVCRQPVSKSRVLELESGVVLMLDTIYFLNCYSIVFNQFLYLSIAFLLAHCSLYLISKSQCSLHLSTKLLFTLSALFSIYLTLLQRLIIYFSYF